MKNNLWLVLLFTGMITFSLFAGDTQVPKNIIFVIADGYGTPARTLTRLATVGAEGKMATDTMRVQSIVKTHSASHLVTDSAAAATAMGTGFKTDNHMVGVNPKGETLENLCEFFQDKGYAIGVMTTAKIFDATPAGFSSHAADRFEGSDKLSGYMVDRKYDVLMGGGYKSFLPKSKGGIRKDDKDVIEQAKTSGYEIIRTRKEVLDLLKKEKAPQKILGLYSDYSHMEMVLERQNQEEFQSQPLLPQMAELGLKVLSNSGKNFFMVIEAARTDHAAHEHDAASVIAEGQEFERTLQLVLDFARKDKNTLVIATADHVTSGLAVSEIVNLEALVNFKASVAFMRSKAMKFKRGESLGELLEKYTPMKGLSSEEMLEMPTMNLLPDDYGFQGKFIGDYISRKYGVCFIPLIIDARSRSAFGHTGGTVFASVEGPGADNFVGFLDNTDFSHIIRKMFAEKK